MDKDVTERDPEFGSHLAGFFYDAFRSVGVTMVATNAMERLRTTGECMAATIEHAAERKAILVAKRLQDAVINGFNAVDAKFQQHKEAKSAMMDVIKTQVEQLQVLREQLGELQQKVAEIEDIVDITDDRFDLAVMKTVKEHEEENETLTDRVAKLEALRVGDVTHFRNKIHTLDGRVDRIAEIEGITEDLFEGTSVKAVGKVLSEGSPERAANIAKTTVKKSELDLDERLKVLETHLRQQEQGAKALVEQFRASVEPTEEIERGLAERRRDLEGVEE